MAGLLPLLPLLAFTINTPSHALTMTSTSHTAHRSNAAATPPVAATASAPVSAPAAAPSTVPTPQDLQQIHTLLDDYTAAVSTGDRERFERGLLDDQIPFYGVPVQLPTTFDGRSSTVRNYAAFRKSVFESGTQFAQRFSHVQIDQDGDLAQVSLQFETRRVVTGDVVRGWKLLHLLKVKGEWKIASEFYTVRREKAATP